MLGFHSSILPRHILKRALASTFIDFLYLYAKAEGQVIEWKVSRSSRLFSSVGT